MRSSRVQITGLVPRPRSGWPRQGASVLLNYLRLPVIQGSSASASPIARIRATATGEDVAAEIVRFGGKAVAIEADLTQPTTVESLFDQAESEFGPVNIVITSR